MGWELLPHSLENERQGEAVPVLVYAGGDEFTGFKSCRRRAQRDSELLKRAAGRLQEREIGKPAGVFTQQLQEAPLQGGGIHLAERQVRFGRGIREAVDGESQLQEDQVQNFLAGLAEA